jgi:3-oxoacyl-[acyl-carrier-protein] synthase-1
MALFGLGMMSAVGLSAPEVAASARSATTRFTQTGILDKHFEPVTLAEVPEDGLPPLNEKLEAAGLTSREVRLLRLADPALRECLASLPAGAAPPPLLLSLPESETTKRLEESRLLDALATQVGGFERTRCEAFFRGRAGGLRALGRAVDWLDAGAPFVVVGGVDTYRDLYVLGTLDVEGRVKSESNLDGFIPGEGAAFLLVSRPGTAAAAGKRPVGVISAFAAGFESGHLYSEQPYRGDGLATTFADALGNAGPVGEVYSSMNGESHWAKEWGVAFIRNRDRFVESHGMHHPADCHGDTGAAAGLIMVGLAALGIQEGYRSSPSLVYASSDQGERAVVLVNSA